ncbi:hypothetical protein EDB83DRAFT_1512338 [Lactarius deliciosus]|nr:hypothetical protein EDB83DRAFT_1512338 [Lactarius deliciosus]
MKDSWRVKAAGCLMEGKVYQILNDGRVPNVPTCLDFCDVGSEEHHQTHTQLIARSLAVASDHQFNTHRHHRLILDTVGKKLNRFKSSRGLVKAINDAIIAHKGAHNIGVLHRDISSGNILITENTDSEGKATDGGGLLIDWDLCKVSHDKSTDDSGEQRHSRTGTWLFMAADLVYNSKIQHSFVHDLESAFYVLLWQSAHYLPSEWGETGLAALHALIGVEVQVDNMDTRKMGFMATPYLLTSLNFPGPSPNTHSPLGELIRSFADMFFPKYTMRPLWSTVPVKKPAFTITHEQVIELFSAALGKVDEWPSSDGSTKIAIGPLIVNPPRRSSKRSREESERVSGVASSKRRLNSGSRV